MKAKNEIKNDINLTQSGQGNKRDSEKKFKITTLPPDFYRRIIDLENKIQLSQPTMDEIKELGSLYKKAIEVFCTSSSKKVKFFSEKLTKLLMGVDKLAKKQNKKPTKWSLYMNSHKKSYNKFMLFLEIESSNQEGELILKNQNEKFGNIFLKYYTNIDEQKKNFKEKMRLKNENKFKNEIKLEKENEIKKEENALIKINEEKENINSINNISNINDNYKLFYNKFKGRNDLVDLSLKDFLRKFHYIYLNSKIFIEPIESFNYILDDIFCHKVAKYFHFQEQIKEFGMLIDDKDQGKNEDALAFLMTDIENERKKYYQDLENYVEHVMKKIQNNCAKALVSKDKNMEKYVEEFMKGISKIFY